MEPCPDKREILWLDVHGELDSRDRQIWNRHLESCRGCGQERARLLELIRHVKEEARVEALSPQEMQEIRATISQKVSQKRRMPGGMKRPSWFIPALGGALVLVVAIGWLGLREWGQPKSVQNGQTAVLNEKTILTDLEVIRNLELLEEMDALQELVKVVDGRDI